jgi:hypothetical protein
LRNFTFFGINIAKTSKYSRQLSATRDQFVLASILASTTHDKIQQPTAAKTQKQPTDH